MLSDSAHRILGGCRQVDSKDAEATVVETRPIDSLRADVERIAEVLGLQWKAIDRAKLWLARGFEYDSVSQSAQRDYCHRKALAELTGLGES